MASRRWINYGQPQTLQFATFLLYFEGVMRFISSFREPTPLRLLVSLAVAILAIAGARGIANDQRSGFAMAVVGAFGSAIMRLLYSIDAMRVPNLGFGLLDAVSNVTGFAYVTDMFRTGGTGIYGYIFEVTLIALLLHRQSTTFRKIWFT